MGASQDAKELLGKLAPQMKDDKLAVVLAGPLLLEGQKDYAVQRFEITKDGVKDTTSTLKGRRFTREGDKPGTASKISPYHPDSLKSLILDAMRDYPARHYILSATSHGNGALGLSGDSNNEGDSWIERFRDPDHLGLPQLVTVLDDVHQETGNKFSIIDLDACLTGQAEVATSLSDYTDFLVASSTVEKAVSAEKDETITTAAGINVPRSGHQQVEVYEKILKDPTVTPESLAREFIEVNRSEGHVVKESHGKVSEFDVCSTLSAYSSKNVDKLADTMDHLGREFSRRLGEKDGLTLIQQAIDKTRVFPSNGGTPFLDLGQFVQEMGRRFDLPKELLKEFQENLDQSTVANFRGTFAGVSSRDDQEPMDMSAFGPMGTVIPGGTGNPFTERLKETARRTYSALKDSDGIDFWEFWERAQRDADKIGLSKGESANVDKIIALLDAESASPRASDERKNYQKQLQAYSTDEKLIQAGAHKIWQHNLRRDESAVKALLEAPGLPVGWKQFVGDLTDRLLEDTMGRLSRG